MTVTSSVFMLCSKAPAISVSLRFKISREEENKYDRVDGFFLRDPIFLQRATTHPLLRGRKCGPPEES